MKIFNFSPDGLKFRSKPDIAAYLNKTKSNLKLDLFDFSKKAMPNDAPASPQKKTKEAAKPKAPSPKKKAATPKKSPKLLVKIVSGKNKARRGGAKKSPEKPVAKAPAKGKKGAKVAAKDSKKKKSS